MRRTALLLSDFVLTSVAAFAIPGVASASEGATPQAAYLQRIVHRHGVPANAEALSPATPALQMFDDSDGLTRDRSECNMGCIDN